MMPTTSICRTTLALSGALLLVACAAPDLAEQGEGDGVSYDETNPYEDFNPKADEERQYQVPQWVLDTELVNPELRVSLDGLTVHLVDTETQFSRIYPTGVGKLGQNSGKSYTPTGFFATSNDPRGSWWNISERFAPAHFGGFPFLRITAWNSNDLNTYGLHGPISYTCTDGTDDGQCALRDRSWFLRQGYVSHGCMRMRAEDIVEVFFLLEGHASAPVTIQEEVEVDSAGELVIAEGVAADWPMEFSPDEVVSYGELGPRPEDWDPCEMPEDWPHRAYGCE
jgi:hypothetical protein